MAKITITIEDSKDGKEIDIYFSPELEKIEHPTRAQEFVVTLYNLLCTNWSLY